MVDELFEVFRTRSTHARVTGWREVGSIDSRKGMTNVEEQRGK